MTTIVWNGCDQYVEADEAVLRGHKFDGERLYHGAHAFEAFEAVEIDPADLPKNEDGEPVVDGVMGSESGRFYRRA